MLSRKGQLSLEYLLILLGAIACFAILLPLLNSIYLLGLFALDSANAKQFTYSMQQQVDEMLFQADGASIQLKARPFTQWNIKGSEERLFVAVLGPDNRKKSFIVRFPNKIGLFDLDLIGEKDFVLRKDSGKTLLEYN